MPLFRLAQWEAEDVDISGCTSCGEDHRRIRFAWLKTLKLKHSQFSELTAVCPKTGDYLLLTKQKVSRAYN